MRNKKFVLITLGISTTLIGSPIILLMYFDNYDVLTVVNILIAFIALLLSVINSLKNLKAPEVNAYMSENLTLLIGRENISMHVPVTFLNVSPTQGVIKRCRLVIINNDGYKNEISWESFCKAEGSSWIKESPVFPLTIPGNEGVSKIVTFEDINQSKDDLVFYEGTSYIMLEITLEEKKDRTHYITRKYVLNTDNEKFNNILSSRANAVEQNLNRHSYYHVPINIK